MTIRKWRLETTTPGKRSRMIYVRFDNTRDNRTGYHAMGGMGDILGRFCSLIEYLNRHCADNFHVYAPYGSFKPSHMEDDERQFVFNLFDPLRNFQTPFEVKGEEIVLSGSELNCIADMDAEKDHYVVVKHFKLGKGGLILPKRRLSFDVLGLYGDKRPVIKNVVIHLRRGDLAFYGQGDGLYDKTLGISESDSYSSIRANHPNFSLSETDLAGLTAEARMNTIRRDIRPQRTQLTVQMCEMLIDRLSPQYEIKIISDGYYQDYRDRFSLDPDALGGNRALHAIREKGVDVILKGDENHIEDTWTVLSQADFVISPTKKSVALLPALLGAHVLPINDLRFANLDTQKNEIDFENLGAHAESLGIPISWRI